VSTSSSSSLWVDSSVARPPPQPVYNNSRTAKLTDSAGGVSSRGASEQNERESSNHKEPKSISRMVAPPTVSAKAVGFESQPPAAHNATTLGHSRQAGHTNVLIGLSARQTLLSSVAADRLCVPDCKKVKKEDHRHKGKSTVS